MSTDYQTAIAYSHNFATAKPDILPTEKEHILGLCQTLESVGEDRDRLSRMFAQACETLGAVQEALGEESSTELTGFEPQLVKKTKEERDALAAHVENLRRELEACQSVLHQLARDGEVTPDYADDAKRALKETPTQSLAHLKAQWQAEALERLYAESQGSGVINRGSLIDEAREYRRQAEGGDT